MRHSAFREICIFISGATPQVITETLCALGAGSPPVLPQEVYIITTEKGRKIAEDTLLVQGILRNLEEEYQLGPIPLNGRSFLVPRDAEDRPLSDIRNDADNARMGELITSLIQEKTDDPACRLHCSLAGGRKTMSFYLGAAMQMFARPWDRLYHVLVTPEFESSPEFFFKPRKARVLSCGGKRLDTRHAEITLTELPFIRLRDKLSLEDVRFRDLVAEGQKQIDIAVTLPELRVDLSGRTVKIGDKAIKLQPLQLMLYVAYLRHKLNRCRYPARPYCQGCTKCFPSLLELAGKTALEEMAKDYHMIAPAKVGDLLHNNSSGLPVETIRQGISKIKRTIGAALDDEALTAIYAITTSERKYADSRHGIRAEKGRIRIG
ncbi:MAG: CRISPR-associated ring nuclease Csm6 [Nitrospiraceae bacterium]|nr:CRISPR-associated ring nuclease Csm6 [Nitrospiraceae bacterium]